MDILAMLMAKVSADKQIDQLNVEDGGLFDRKIAVGTLLNYIRNSAEDWSEYGFVGETGTVTLTNNKPFLFNNSSATVALAHTQPDTNYAVIANILSSNGNAGEIEVSAKLVNGFTIGFTGSATSVSVEYLVIGGF